MTERLLLIDDDPVFRELMLRRLEREGMSVQGLAGPEELDQVRWPSLDYILLDLMLESGTGLDVIAELKARFQPRHLVVLTGYASIATTVEAMKRGASNYMAKPLDSRRLLAILRDEPARMVDPPDSGLSQTRPTPAQLEWEHIQTVLLEHGGNVSLTARALGMHRRTLQRKLKKHSPLR